ncbi:DUF1554 domain-containing protein [Leptospira fletcheri]|uniref:DUF1554 domain-containing protein n=1 Tax=Leptospira fletcheri TaxID=2484981 RepID=A0A4R9GG01_9LEPT|nr:DUF1554 domain-containing protein [Leptospira fletcheri]TGK11469.1 DUF1554 domain-containing protein [Leptospira fletcheri]
MKRSLFRSSRFLSGIFFLFLFGCNQAKPLNIDASKSAFGALLPNIIALLSGNPLNFSPAPTITEGTSLSVSIQAAHTLDSPTTFTLGFSNSVFTVSPATITLSATSPSATVTLTHGIDNDCLDQVYGLIATQKDTGAVQTLNVATTDVDKCTFVATNSAQGGIGYFGTFGGVTGADAACAADKPSSLPGATTDYKALITVTTGSPARYVTTTANCGLPATPSCSPTNWVLYTNTRYFGSDGLTYLFTTHAQAPIFYFSGGNLSHSLGFSGGGAWTGLKLDWTEAASYQCMTVGTYQEWASPPYSSYINNAHFGDLSAVNSTALDTGTAATDCTAVRKNLFCIRQ